MLLSVAVFWVLKNKYLVTPDGKGIGLPPKESELRAEKDAAEAAAHVAETATQPERKNSPLRLWGCIVGAIALFVLFIQGAESFNDYISAAIYAISIALPVFIITDRTLTKTEKMRIGVIYIIALFVIFFWSAFEQAGSSLTLFADRQVDRNIGSFEVKTTWFQSVNAICVVIFAPVMAGLWQFLGKRNCEPDSPVKQSIGLLLLAIGYLIISFATKDLAPGVKVSMFWLLTLYFIHTLGELSLSPIGLSMVTKLSPAHLASLLMGVWFMSNAASNILAGKLAALLPVEGQPAQSFLGFEIATLDQFFMLFAVMSGVAAVLLFCLCPLLKKMMKGVE
jgi:POT family proton-dependent oligopeptide transporter